MKKSSLFHALICCLCVLLVCTFFVELPTTYAWLSSALRSSTFSIKSSSVSDLTAELWVNAYEKSNDWTSGWYAEDIDATLSTKTATKFNSIGSFGTKTLTDGSTVSTFTPRSAIALHFGTINNLAQEQENQPIYLKFSIAMKPLTQNTVILTYKNDVESVGGQYVSVYTIDFSNEDPTSHKYVGTVVQDGDILEELNDIDAYPFLRFHYFVSTTDYTFVPGVSNLSEVQGVDASGNESTVDFPSLFETENNPTVQEYTLKDTSSHEVDFDNNTKGIQNAYIYVKINVRSDTLSRALSDSDLKNVIPGYLLFAVILGLEIRTTAVKVS